MLKLKKRTKRKIKNIFLCFTTWLMAVVMFTSYWIMELTEKSTPEMIVALAFSFMWCASFLCINWKYIERKCSCDDEIF